MPYINVSVNVRDESLLSAAINVDTSGNQTAIASVTNKIIKVYKLYLAVATAMAITFKDGSNASSGAVSLAVGTPLVLPFDTQPWFTCSVGNAFVLDLSASDQLSGQLFYTIESVVLT